MDNLVEKTVRRRSADMGNGSTRRLSDMHFEQSHESSTDAGINPQSVNRGKQP
jgi:hypothetical protein